MICLPDCNSDFFDIVAGVLQGSTLEPYLFISCLNYAFRTSEDLIKENAFTLKRIIRHPAETMIHWVECSPIARKIGVQSQVELYQRLKKWYLMLPCLTLSIIRYGSRVKWSYPGKRVAPFSTFRFSTYWKGSLRVTLD